MVPRRQRAPIWSQVGTVLRRLHEVDVSRLSFLDEPRYQRPWTRFVPYFAKSLRRVKEVRPDLGPAIVQLLELRPSITAHLDACPPAVCFNAGLYQPGMLLERSRTGWRCTSWLSLGYYVSISDPARDVVSISLSHREWTGEDVPQSFFRSYGSRPDPVRQLVYETALLVGRGATYQRGDLVRRRPSWGPPPHSTAIEALDNLPDTVRRLRSLLGNV